jgi:hypothetical protein
MGKNVLLSGIPLIILMAMTMSSPAQDTDPNLVGWWTFDDEGTGTVLDSSGNERHGTFRGDAHFVPGLLGEAVAFDGSGDYVNIDGYKGIVGDGTGIHAFTITAWIKATGNGEIVGWGSTVVPGRVEFRINEDRLRYESGGGNVQGDTTVTDDEWHHVAVTVPTDALYVDVTIYLDGEDDTQPENDTDPSRPTAQYDLKMGLRYNEASSRQYTGLIDDVRLYDKVLTQAEIQALAVRPRAYDPSPADGAMGVTDPMLSWQPRKTAVFRDVYLSTSPELGPDDLVSAQQTSVLYWHGPGLEPGTAYYWRVDEIEADGTVHQGDVWMFFFSPLEAWQPAPMDGAPYMDPDLTLNWERGLNGISHDVYFGTDETAVAEGTDDVFRGNQFDMTFVTGDLEMETTYYWRVDEVDMAGDKVTGNVWSFSTLPEIPIADPNLRVWWKLDAGVGERAVDWSGHGSHGEFVGDPVWVEGYDGFALEFDGLDDHVVYSFDAVEDWSAFTVCVWVKAAMLGQDINSSPFSSHTPNTAGLQIDVDGGDPGSYRVNHSSGAAVIGTARTDWVHLAITATGTAAKLYHNGLWTASTILTDTLFNKFAIGVNRNVANWFAGAIDDLRVFDRELSQEELELVMRIDPLRAWNPQPGNGSIADIRTATALTWTKGDEASEHAVYFGTDEAAVAAADASDTTGIYRDRFSATSYTPEEDLQWGQKYFWRVDELNADGSTTTGRVWNFTVADYLIIDDFESYTDNFDAGQAIFQAWIDGWTDGTNGSIVGNLEAPFAEQTIVYSGRQAMPMDYNNIPSPWYSEAYRTWETPQDWTFAGVDTLVVFIRGQVPAFIETAPGAITLSAAGADIWDISDEFRYAFKRLTGDGSIIARVDSITDTHAWAKGGVMIRESLDLGSRHGMVVVTPRNGVSFQRRPANSDSSVSTTQSGIVAPHWVKLTRTGDTLTAQHSADGVTWGDVLHATDPTSDTVVMGTTVYIGLALTSHVSGTPCTAEFSGIETTGNVSGSWQVADIGITHPGNAPDSVYVAVEDSAGNVAVVTHPEPAATTITEYEPWAVDLASLAGVNVSRVKTLYVGVGDRDNPQPGGAGRIYLDDIRVIKMPVLTLEPSTDMVATGDKGMILSINGIDVNDLVLGTTSFAGEPKYADQGPAGADNFDLNADASADEQAYVDVLFAQPVTTIFLVEKGGNDTGFIQALYEDGAPIGAPVAFSPDSYGAPGYIVYQDQAGALMVIRASVPIYGIRILPPEGGVLGIDPVSVSAIAE